jgi:hypothetical protein
VEVTLGLMARQPDKCSGKELAAGWNADGGMLISYRTTVLKSSSKFVCRCLPLCALYNVWRKEAKEGVEMGNRKEEMGNREWEIGKRKKTPHAACHRLGAGGAQALIVIYWRHRQPVSSGILE